jgi:hypothetical protein
MDGVGARPLPQHPRQRTRAADRFGCGPRRALRGVLVGQGGEQLPGPAGVGPFRAGVVSGQERDQPGGDLGVGVGAVVRTGEDVVAMVGGAGWRPEITDQDPRPDQ